MILSGEQSAVVHAVQLVSLHGTEMLDLVYAHTDAPAELRRARLGLEAVEGDLRPGDAVSVSYLLNTATGARKINT